MKLSSQIRQCIGRHGEAYLLVKNGQTCVEINPSYLLSKGWILLRCYRLTKWGINRAKRGENGLDWQLIIRRKPSPDVPEESKIRSLERAKFHKTISAERHNRNLEDITRKIWHEMYEANPEFRMADFIARAPLGATKCREIDRWSRRVLNVPERHTSGHNMPFSRKEAIALRKKAMDMFRK